MILNFIIVLLGIMAGAFLWHLGGQGYKWAREWIFPCMLGVAKIAINITHFYFWSILYIAALMGLLSLFSYGKGTFTHKFWVSLFKKGAEGDYPPVEIATRATCGFFWSLPGLIFVWGGGSILWFAVYSVLLTVGNGIIGGLDHNVETSEPIVGALVSCSLFI